MPSEKLIETHVESPTEEQVRRSMLLTALYIAQKQHGHLSKEALQRTDERLRIAPKEVYSTASFYSLFRFQPQGRYTIQVCEGLTCHLAGGAERLVGHIRRKLSIEVGQPPPPTGSSPYGLSMSQRMHEDPEYRDIPILMVTSIANTDYAVLFPTDEYLHIDGFMSKSISHEKLLRTIEQLLGDRAEKIVSK